MSTDIRCPECGSTNVECVEKPHHDHICHHCGHTVLPRTDADRAALVRSAQNDTDQMTADWDGVYGSPGDPTFAEVDNLITEVKKLWAQMETVGTLAESALGSAVDHMEAKTYLAEAADGVEQLSDLLAQIRAFR
jgi:transcription initiation factor TFIIIB Brf1 subunit/transcription initiation factor TFIIB